MGKSPFYQCDARNSGSGGRVTILNVATASPIEDAAELQEAEYGL